jgi:hypothetical protein
VSAGLAIKPHAKPFSPHARFALALRTRVANACFSLPVRDNIDERRMLLALFAADVFTAHRIVSGLGIVVLGRVCNQAG